MLEGSAAYVFASPGCKKWDTCAVEAVLAAAGEFLGDHIAPAITVFIQEAT